MQIFQASEELENHTSLFYSIFYSSLFDSNGSVPSTIGTCYMYTVSMVPDNFTISYTLGPLYLNTAEVSMKLFSFAYFICVLGVCCLKIWKSSD